MRNKEMFRLYCKENLLILLKGTVVVGKMQCL